VTGLVRENGITRWLAGLAVADGVHSYLAFPQVGLSEVRVAEVFDQDEKQVNFDFVPRSERLDTTVNAFLERVELRGAVADRADEGKGKAYRNRDPLRCPAAKSHTGTTALRNQLTLGRALFFCAELAMSTLRTFFDKSP
jgi:hypothetical protein